MLLVLALALSEFACDRSKASRSDGPEVLDLTQGTFSGGDFPLQIERRDESRVLELRRQERLDDVVAGSKSQLQVFERLLSWTRAQFVPGDPDPYPLSNGLSILAEIRAGRTGGFCGQYSYLLGDALKSLGFWSVRYVELESESGAGHFAVEVWCDDLSRWILLDPLHAALYERDGQPLSAFELHNALLAGQQTGIHLRRVAYREPRADGALLRRALAPSPPPSDAELLALFYNVAVSTRNDFAGLDHPLTIAERESFFLRYADPRIVPFRHMSFALSSVRREDFLTPMDQVAIETRPEPGSALLHVSFSTRGTCPHFARYRVRIGDGPWKESGALLGWTLAPGENTLEVRTVNALGILGPVFRVKVRG